MNYKEKYDKITLIEGEIKLIVLKISGIIASLLIIPALLLLLPVSVKVNSENDKKISVKIKILIFTVFSNKKPKKKKHEKNSSENQKSYEKSGENKERIKRIKHLLGIDRFDSFKKLCRNVKEGGIDGTF